MRKIYAKVRLVDGPEICTATDVMVSAYKVVATDVDFLGDFGRTIREALHSGNKVPVMVYLEDGKELVFGEAFMHQQTPDRLHVGIFRHYLLDEEPWAFAISSRRNPGTEADDGQR